MTDKQRIAFFKVFQQAAERQGIPPGEREVWRHEIVREACGVPSLKAVGSGADFDRLMAHVSRLAESHGEAIRWGTAEGRRLAAMAEACARQCFEIAQAIPALAEQWAPGAIPYLRGVMAQAGWRDALHGAAAEALPDARHPPPPAAAARDLRQMGGVARRLARPHAPGLRPPRPLRADGERAAQDAPARPRQGHRAPLPRALRGTRLILEITKDTKQ